MAQTSMPPRHPVNVVCPYPERSSRGWAIMGLLGIKAIALIPHIFVLLFVQLLSGIVIWLGFWAVLFTGKYPRGLYNFALGSLRWQTRIAAWYDGLVDKCPPFTMQE